MAKVCGQGVRGLGFRGQGFQGFGVIRALFSALKFIFFPASGAGIYQVFIRGQLRGGLWIYMLYGFGLQGLRGWGKFRAVLQLQCVVGALGA